jgi:tRNA (cytidine32/uridine32-2'-O)-methyltransferase
MGYFQPLERIMPNIRVILVNPSHPGNIGATARAMKVMGLLDLFLVAPKRFPDPDATARATGAADLLMNAQVVSTLSEALVDCVTVYAATARERSLAIPTVSARDCGVEVAQSSGEKIAFVFGRESSGLTNEELSLAHRAVSIPTSSEFSSLNLAAAVQIIAYECFLARHIMQTPPIKQMVQKGEERASMEQMGGLYAHLEKTLTNIEFLKPKQSAMLMQRLTRLYNRTQLSVNELNILRGILSDTDRHIRKAIIDE